MTMIMNVKLFAMILARNYYRPKMPNTHPLFIGAIVDEIKSIF
ncbi:Ferrochelatase, protoheme ferro-lyase [Staphylococcus aureus]|uniref:Ferrochelatase, protoheme ferro-lyase n=1 Tax=Staphylococcus aureus TaxID=1280 RepID=A0A380DX71_STAAU|nr:Ferrochelatase, protoheme ferro-lyase [Staphylococcus aureus]